MLSLFNSFDLKIFSMSFLPMIYLLNMFVFISLNNMNLSVLKILFMELKKFMNSLNKNMWSSNLMMCFLSTSMLIATMNFSSIFPFNFTITSQVSIVMGVSLTFWTMINLFTLIFNTSHMMIHLVPEGTPLFLTLFISLIELISNMIRSITLSVRLIANMMAGHLLMILLCNLMIMMKLNIMLIFMILMSLEMFVSFVQAYIFLTLMSLYYSEM